MINYNDISAYYGGSAHTKNTFTWTNVLSRNAPFPIEEYSVFNSYAAASAYAANDGLAYEGQIIAVTENGATTVYVLDTTAAGGLKALATGGSTEEIMSKLNAEIARSVSVDSELSGAISTITETTLPRAVRGLESGLSVTVEKLDSPESGFEATYVVKQGGEQVGASINIPKDKVISGAYVVDVTGEWDASKEPAEISAFFVSYNQGETTKRVIKTVDPDLFGVINNAYSGTGGGDGKYLRITVTNAEALPIYIAMPELVDTYVGGETNTITVDVEASTRTITASVKDSAISAAQLFDGAVIESKIAVDAITTGKIKDGNVTTAKIADDAVTNGKIAANAVESEQILSGAVVTGKIANGAVTSDKLADGSVTSEKIADGAVSTVDIADAAVTHAKLATDAVESGNIKDGNVTTAKIADKAVTAVKIGDGAVGEAQLSADAVTTDKIAASAVTTAKIADSNVTTDKIADSGVTTAKIADTAVTTAKIADGNVTHAKLATDAVESGNIKDGSVVTAKIADSNVTTAKIADDAVTNDKIADNAVAAAQLSVGSVIAEKIADSAVTTAKIADSNVTTAKIADDAVTNDKIADNAIDSAQLSAGSVITAKIVDSAVTTAKIADSNVTTAKIADSNVTTAKIADGNVTKAKLAEDVGTWISGVSSDVESAAKAYTDSKVTSLSTEIKGDISEEASVRAAADSALDMKFTGLSVDMSGISADHETRILSVEDKVAKLSSAMHFKGVNLTVELSTGSTTVPVPPYKTGETPSDGDVVIAKDSKEFVWANNQWNEFGAEGIWATKASLEAETAARTAADAQISAKVDSKVKIGDYNKPLSAVGELSVIRIADEDYYKLVAEGTYNESALYVVSSDYVNAHDQRVINVGTAVSATDAVNLSGMQTAIAAAKQEIVERSLSGVTLNGQAFTVANNVAVLDISCINCGDAN